MTMIGFTLHHTLPAAYALLPHTMDSDDANALLLAIGLQESRFRHRVQIRGPARGFWQFERGGGVHGVLTHEATRERAFSVCHALNYHPDSYVVHEAIAHNDVLAACFARLLLWTLPEPLPGPDDPDEGWRQYMAAWRPGKPHPDTWTAHYRLACELVHPDYSTGE